MSPIRPMAIRRRRPLLRAAAVGGGAYVAGRATARRSAERAEWEADQDERIADLERAQRQAGQQQAGQQQAGQRQAGQRQAAQPAPAPGAAGPSLLDQLSELTAMHERGALTDSEFAAAKARLLGLPEHAVLSGPHRAGHSPGGRFRRNGAP